MPGRGGRERRPAASRGQTETIGVVIVLAMTLIGATVALAFGATGLNAARIDSQQGGVEHALTQLDSRSAMVALGDSGTQRVRLATAGEGSYRIDPDAGWIKVSHFDYDGNDNDTVIYNATLGALVYEHDGTRIAYQGGGVWVAEGGGSRMISPPEFHYQAATLTLPVIQVDGTSSAGGMGITANVNQVTSAHRIYPNLSQPYPNSSEPFANPVSEGNVTVTVKSEYYQAWAAYFRTRTSGEVTVNDTEGLATVELVTAGTDGAFAMPSDGNDIEIRGLGDDHPITDFTVTIRPDDTDSANFGNLQWSIYADQGSQEFEIHLRDTGKNNSLTTPYCTVRDVGATVYYSDRNGDPYHGWHDDYAFNTDCTDFDGDGDNETFLEVDLVGPTPLRMQKLSKLNHFGLSGDTFKDPVTFDEHDGVTWEITGKTFNETEQTTMGNLTNHYLSLMGPSVELTIEDKGSDSVNEETSTGNFVQTGGAGRIITYLHITENRVVVELE